MANSTRLQPVRLRDNPKDSLVNELKSRLFFKLCLEDNDFANENNAASKGLFRPINNKSPHLMVSGAKYNACLGSYPSHEIVDDSTTAAQALS